MPVVSTLSEGILLRFNQTHAVPSTFASPAPGAEVDLLTCRAIKVEKGWKDKSLWSLYLYHQICLEEFCQVAIPYTLPAASSYDIQMAAMEYMETQHMTTHFRCFFRWLNWIHGNPKISKNCSDAFRCLSDAWTLWDRQMQEFGGSDTYLSDAFPMLSDAFHILPLQKHGLGFAPCKTWIWFAAWAVYLNNFHGVCQHRCKRTYSLYHGSFNYPFVN